MDGADNPKVPQYPTVEDNDELKFKGAASRAKHHGKQQEAPDECVICIQPITDRAVAAPCDHLAFDFICLVSWLQHRETCPLCNGTITEVQYDWQSPDNYKAYRPNQRASENQKRIGTQASRRTTCFWTVPPNPRAGCSARNDPVPYQQENEKIARRRKVYQEKLYSLHIGANSISQYRNFTPQDFVNSGPLQSRARMFLRRELLVFSYFDSVGQVRNREFILEYVVAILKKFDPKGADGRAEDFLSDFLERGNARLLLHELQAWLRSPYATLKGWDENVQYADGNLRLLRIKGSSAT